MVFDIASAYHQLCINKSSQDLFAFRLPQGIYYYERAPMGMVASGDWLLNHTDLIFAGLRNCMKEMDDLLLEATNEEEMVEVLKPFLDRCCQNGIYLSRSKTHGIQEVEYASLSLSATEGCRPSMEKYKALQEI